MNNNKNNIQIPQEIHGYLWTRYLPETTYKMYLLIGYLQKENKRGKEATEILLNADLNEERSVEKIVEEKKKVLKKFGYEYPQNSKEDLELLLSFKLIKIAKDQEDNITYLYNLPVPKVEEVIGLDEEELNNIKNIRFEIEHEKGMNMILTMLLNGNGSLGTTLDYIYKTTKVKLTGIRAILIYLVEEGSISIRANKSIDKLKKDDKLLIKIEEEVFNQKRVIL